jgi:hypothetical protein
MPHQRGGQTIVFTARQQHVLAAERADNLLADAAAIAFVLDKVEIGIASRQLLADNIEWLSADSSSISSKSEDLLKMFHYATGRIPEIRPRRPKQIDQLLNRSPRQLFKLGLTWPPEIAHTANA